MAEDIEYAPQGESKPGFNTTIRGFGLGWKPDIPDVRDHLYKHVHTATVPLPPRVSLRAKFPYVFNQGSLGCCTACAGTLLFNILKGVKKLADSYSRLEYYYNERVMEGTVDQDAGAQIRTGIKCLANQGIAKETEWPFVISRFKVAPSRNVVLSGEKNKLIQYSRLATRSDFQQCIAQGFGFTFGFTCYESIDSEDLARTGIMQAPQPSEKVLGGHAVSCIGYDFDFYNNPVFKKSKLSKDKVSSKMYEIQNSWGNWGDAGRFWMPAELLENGNFADDAWTLRSVA